MDFMEYISRIKGSLATKRLRTLGIDPAEYYLFKMFHLDQSSRSMNIIYLVPPCSPL